MDEVRHKATSRRSLVAAIGASMLFGWGFLAHLSPALLYSPASPNIEYAYFASLGSTGIVATLICLKPLHDRIAAYPGTILILAVALSLLTAAEAVVASISDNVAALIVLGVLDGICQPLLLVAWGARFVWEAKSLVQVIVSAYALAIVLYFSVAALPLSLRLLATTITVLLPVLSAAVWRIDSESRSRLAPELDEKWLRRGNTRLGEMVAGASNLRMLPLPMLAAYAVTAFLSDLISSAMVNFGYEVSSKMANWGFLFSLLLCLCCLFAIKVRPLLFSAEGASRVLFPIVVLGMLAIIVFGPDVLTVSVGVLRAVGLFFAVIVWLLIASATQREGLSPLISFGFGTALISSIEFLGHMSGLSFYLTFGDIRQPLNIAIGISIILIFMLMTVVSSRPNIQAGRLSRPACDDEGEDGREDARHQPTNADADSAFECKMQRFSSSYALTGREFEIVVLIVRGRSTPRIAEMLFVTSGTIKTHLTHIYRKMGVTGRQGLIDLFDGFD